MTELFYQMYAQDTNIAQRCNDIVELGGTVRSILPQYSQSGKMTYIIIYTK